jgi:hypothetical protein
MASFLFELARGQKGLRRGVCWTEIQCWVVKSSTIQRDGMAEARTLLAPEGKLNAKHKDRRC